MSKFSKEQLLKVLGYSDSPNYRSTADQHHPLTAHLFREAKRAGAEGAYTFHTSPNDEILPPRPAVYVAEANTREEAREIHRSLWNLGNVPFLIVVLPNELRVYTGFDYDQKNQTRGLIDHVEDFINVDLGERLADYSADSIDSGRLWANQASHLRPDNRLDTHLLRNLKKLEAVLRNNNGLELEIAHALIGKYVYIRYLWDRQILSEQWRAENKIKIDSVLGRKATVKGLRKLVDALDECFNGHIFPLPLRGTKAPTNDQVALVASAFEGDDPVSGQMTAFGLYNFSYIPVETLSAIYEQFLHAQGKGKKGGAVYTPEHLADYLLAELNHAKPLESGMKVLDPCCGSGIFLVLAYRKLIELELRKRPNQKLLPTELRAILTKSIFGVERNKEACLVTELSLILTMLHYISPPELHRNKRFKFPPLHNEQIFEADFFDSSSAFWQKGERFDWVIGNPPWIEPEKDNEEEQPVLSWIYDNKNRRNHPVAGNRVVEAFSWLAPQCLNENGYVGLVLHATSFFNYESRRYRQEFFKQHEVIRITNFTNLRKVLFEGRGVAPAATITYRPSTTSYNKPPIVHYGPFLVNHIFSHAWEHVEQKDTWILSLNESEISIVSAEEAEKGDSVTWKLALWGTNRDRISQRRIRLLFQSNLEELRKKRGWYLHQGTVFGSASLPNGKVKYEYSFTPELQGRKYFDANKMSESQRRYSVPHEAFQPIPESHCHVRKRSGRSSLDEEGGAYIIFNVSYAVFSADDFVLQAPDKRLSAKSNDRDELRSLALLFSSSLIQYYLFFLSPSWGVERDKIYKEDIKQLPVPNLTPVQINQLALLHKDLVTKESTAKLDAGDLQKVLDDKIGSILGIPKNISVIAEEFVRVRLLVNEGKISGIASQPPQTSDLLAYGQLLRNQLDDFTKGRVCHRVSLVKLPDQEVIVCEVEATSATQQHEVSFDSTNSQMKTSLNQLKQKLRQQFSQWVYVQRNLRIFDGPKVYICKAPRLIDWTKTQALNDADDLIAEVLSGNFGEREVAVNASR